MGGTALGTGGGAAGSGGSGGRKHGRRRRRDGRWWHIRNGWRDGRRWRGRRTGRRRRVRNGWRGRRIGRSWRERRRRGWRIGHRGPWRERRRRGRRIGHWRRHHRRADRAQRRRRLVLVRSAARAVSGEPAGHRVGGLGLERRLTQGRHRRHRPRSRDRHDHHRRAAQPARGGRSRLARVPRPSRRPAPDALREARNREPFLFPAVDREQPAHLGRRADVHADGRDAADVQQRVPADRGVEPRLRLLSRARRQLQTVLRVLRRSRPDLAQRQRRHQRAVDGDAAAPVRALRRRTAPTPSTSRIPKRTRATSTTASITSTTRAGRSTAATARRFIR